MEEHSIITDLLNNDPEEAVILIYKTYFSRLCLIAHNHLRNPKDAEDLIQDLMADLWKRRNHLQINSSLDGYLIKALLYKINAFKKKNRIDDRVDQEIMHENPIAQMEAAELKTLINDIIDALPERKRECFLLSRNNHLTHKEIAGKLGISAKTVDHHITQALRIIRQKLKTLYLIIF